MAWVTCSSWGLLLASGCFNYSLCTFCLLDIAVCNLICNQETDMEKCSLTSVYWCQYPFPDLDTDLYHEMQKTASLECLSVFDRACLTWEKLCCIFHTKCLPGYFGATVWPCLSIPTSRNGGCDWLRRNRSGTVLPCLPAIRIKALLDEFWKTLIQKLHKTFHDT